MENSYKFFKNDGCRYYPCHEGIDEVNCMFCYCPFYKDAECPGTPKTIENNGMKIKDCSDCLFPHKAENYEQIIRLLSR